ncbi:hypothetical protein ACWKWU_03025 [Chitinophaga lutea]
MSSNIISFLSVVIPKQKGRVLAPGLFLQRLAAVLTGKMPVRYSARRNRIRVY